MSVINTNISSLNAQNNLARSQGELQTSLQRLSSGLRINSAKDDAAGLQISNRQTSQINGLNVAARNANDGISIAQVAEGALQESTNILQRMRELALQAANGSNSSSDRAALQKEVVALQAELTRIADTSAFGGQKLLNGTFGSQDLQVGSQANETINISLQNVSATSIGGQSVKNTEGLNFAGFVTTDPGDLELEGGTITILNGTTEQAGIITLEEEEVFDAKIVADKINAISSTTNVIATARTEVELEITFDDDDGIGGEIGTSRGATNLDGLSDLQSIVDKINRETGDTGLSASINAETGNIRLVSAEGRNILFNLDTADEVNVSSVINGVVDTDTEVDVVGEEDAVAAGSINLTSTDKFSLSSEEGDLAEIFGQETSRLETISDVNISTSRGAQDAIAVIDGAIATIDANRADLGALQNRLESTISNLRNISENVSAARSRIQDADFAQETSNLTRIQILQQAGTSILAQANTVPQSVLSLLQ
ncbi:flagellin [Nitrincola schmidtii]|uniref:flagellin n=1 Tax=Nitrincola schmidtii TaxID=1730894 RepID=UPI00124DB3BD|nr:flagellin [Nitrincola schmidtii]